MALMRQWGSVLIEGSGWKTGIGRSNTSDSLYWRVFKSNCGVLAFRNVAIVHFKHCERLSIASW